MGVEAADVAHLAGKPERHAQRLDELCERGDPFAPGMHVVVGVDVRRIAPGQLPETGQLLLERLLGVRGIVQPRAFVDEVQAG